MCLPKSWLDSLFTTLDFLPFSSAPQCNFDYNLGLVIIMAELEKTLVKTQQKQLLECINPSTILWAGLMSRKSKKTQAKHDNTQITLE